MHFIVFFFLPLVFVFTIFLIPSKFKKLIFYISLFFLLFHFIYFLYALFSVNIPFIYSKPWIRVFNINFSFYLDKISVLLVILNLVLFISGIIFSLTEIEEKVKEFLIWTFLLEFGINGIFMAGDIFLFFISWEFMLIPMFFIIYGWGYEKREYAAFKFLLYTMAGSVLLIVGILILIFYFKNTQGYFSFNIRLLSKLYIPPSLSGTLFFLFTIPFFIKVPLFPFHTWLPDAHTQAPSFGSVILAGILLKTGVYGIIRFTIPFFPQFVKVMSNAIIMLSLFNIIYGSLMAWVQKDLKRLIAYSSIGHMGFIILGIFVFQKEAFLGSVFQVFNHGITTGALFMIAGAIYKRTGTREIRKLGGLAGKIPVLAFIFGFSILSSIGLPGLNNFAGEFLILYGVFKKSVVLSMISVLGIILTAVYFLSAYRKTIFGKAKDFEVKDLKLNEVLSFIPLILLMLYLGLKPVTFLKNFKNTSNDNISTLNMIEDKGNEDFTARH